MVDIVRKKIKQKYSVGIFICTTQETFVWDKERVGNKVIKNKVRNVCVTKKDNVRGRYWDEVIEMKEMVDVKCIFIGREKEKMVPAAFTFFFFCFRERAAF